MRHNLALKIGGKGHMKKSNCDDGCGLQKNNNYINYVAREFRPDYRLKDVVHLPSFSTVTTFPSITGAFVTGSIEYSMRLNAPLPSKLFVSINTESSTSFSTASGRSRDPIPEDILMISPSFRESLPAVPGLILATAPAYIFTS